MNKPFDTCFFFGTFNPIHLGHLLMAETARTQFGFRRVVFIPASVPPHRQQENGLAPFEHRYQMACLACRNNPFFQVSDIEHHRPGPSYTVDTLRHLLPNFNELQAPIPMIIGTDALGGLGSWHQPEVLVEKVLFLQAPRETVPLQTVVTIGQTEVTIRTESLNMPYVGISSTQIRQRIQQGQSLRYLTPQPVIDYIDWNNLYQEN